jgi:hypothetical protein
LITAAVKQALAAGSGILVELPSGKSYARCKDEGQEIAGKAAFFPCTKHKGAMDMKRKLAWSAMAFAVLSFSVVCVPMNGVAGVALKVLNPLGEIAPPPISAPSARIPDLAGKKIAIYWNGKAGGDNFWGNIEDLLKEKLQGVTILRFSGPFDLGDTQAAKIAGESDAFFYGVGD